jgi:uncharacterized protein YfiM (DUF2279 family)
VRFGFVLVFGAVQFGAAPERARQGPDDHWLARDKAYHFVASALIQSVAHTALRTTGSPYAEASVAAGVVTLGAGVGKELWDRSRGRIFSWKDLGADFAGGGTGAVLVRQLDDK